MSRQPWIHIGELAQQAVAEAEIRTEFRGEIRGLETGISSLDERISPALDAGRLVIIAGESGRGKTALAAQMAVAFAHQTPTLWLSLEDPDVDATRRVLANVARVPVSGLRQGFKTGEVPDAARDGAEVLAKLPLFIQSEAGHVLDIARNAAAWVKSHGSTGPIRGVLIIDQMSHIAPVPYDAEFSKSLEQKGLPVPPRQRDAEHKVLEWTTMVLREIAVRLNMLVVCLHQLNQIRGEDGRPGMESVRGSQGIVHKSDLCLIPYRPKSIPNPFGGPGQPKTTPAPEDLAEIICVKGRAVAGGWSLKVKWDGAHQRFADESEAAVLGETPAYVAPAPFSEKAVEGAMRLQELRTRLALQRAADRRALPGGEQS